MQHQQNNTFKCPSCNECMVDILDYDSFMVLRPDVGLFTCVCPGCGSKTSIIRPIPASLQDEVRRSAAEVHAGMNLSGSVGETN